jgi:hypothetical protein
MKLYLSGPIMHDPDHRANFLRAAECVREAGYVPINPIDVPAGCGGACADSGRAVLPSGHTWECYLKYDLVELLKCDGIMMLNGWTASQGARLELHIAASVGLSVHFQSVHFESASGKDGSTGDVDADA